MVGQGVSFDAQFSLTVGDDGLRHALLTGIGRMQAYVLRQPGTSALGQLRFLAGEQHARLAYVAPALEEGTDRADWLCLLDGLAVMAGQRGAVTVTAEVDPAAPEFEVLRRAGFATYARQGLWVRPPAPLEPSTLSLRPAEPGDKYALLGFYNSLAPGLIKHVEPPPTAADACYVLDGPRGVAGMVAAYQGGQATLVEAYVAPDGPLGPRQFLNAALAAAQADRRRVFCRMRDYMGLPATVLDDGGFEHLASQAVMFRHTVVCVVNRSYKLKEKVDGGVPLPTSMMGLEDEALSAIPLPHEGIRI